MTKWPMWNAVVNLGDVEAVKKELQKPGYADIDFQEKDHPVYRGSTYLMAAVRANRIDLVNLLLEHGANPNLLDDFDKTAMHYAVSLGSKELFEILIKSPKADVNQVINNNNALLQVLMSEGKQDWGQIMVDAGADINLHTQDLATPLIQTLAAGQTDSAKWLIGLGADIKTGFDGISPLCFAASSNLVEVMALMMEKGASLAKGEYITTPLHAAARNHKLEALKFCLEKGVDVNAEDHEEETAIMQGSGSIEIVNLLLEKGAVIDSTKPMRYLFNAATNGSSKSLHLFLDTYKMDANTTNEDGQTALFEAATVDACDSTNSTEHIEVLLRHGADPNIKETKRGTTALLYAVFNRKTANISKLLQAGANPNAQDSSGLTPLHMACGRGLLEEAQLLVSAGGSININDSNGESPADYAKNTFGTKALHVAIQSQAQNKKGCCIIM
eukprot:Phypoly_transcript_07968.p1 GENE.Phypoly_transcript_07968~~Phypoly_transcript_07968.p1  ORF type:complete len:522 (+),score=112.25 Phypoly_transcript_07968:235-1566(+)